MWDAFLFLFLLNGAPLSSLTSAPARPVLWLSAFHSLSPWGLGQRTGEAGHLTSYTAPPPQPLVAEGPSSPLPFPAHLQYLPNPLLTPCISSVLSSPESWLVGAPAGPRSKTEAVSEPAPQKTNVFKARLVLPG